MNWTVNGASTGEALLAMAVAALAALYWMYVAWRAMRAHERLAAALERLALHSTRPAAASARERDGA